MRLDTSISPEELEMHIEEFLFSTGRQKLRFVQHRPKLDSRFRGCFYNAIEKNEREGGAVSFGWIFNFKVSSDYGKYLTAINHAIWLSSESIPMDVTHYDDTNRPFIKNGFVAFSPDKLAHPIKVSNCLVPHPCEFFPISQNEGLEDYLKERAQEEQKAVQDIINSIINENIDPTIIVR